MLILYYQRLFLICTFLGGQVHPPLAIYISGKLSKPIHPHNTFILYHYFCFLFNRNNKQFIVIDIFSMCYIIFCRSLRRSTPTSFDLYFIFAGRLGNRPLLCLLDIYYNKKRLQYSNLLHIN